MSADPTIVAQLVDRRTALAMSQTQLAALMGTSQSAVSDLEAGRADIRTGTLKRWAGALGLHVRIAFDDIWVDQ